MHGLINRAIQCFVRDTYGGAIWSAVAREAGLRFDSFEPMLTYDPSLTDAVIDAASTLLRRPRDTVLEDLGIYLVSHPNLQALRRLLRFGGVTYEDFLHSLDDMPDRARLAVPDIDLPNLALTDHSGTEFSLSCRSEIAGAGHVIVGMLRAMADDYGVLGLVDHQGTDEQGDEVIAITLAQTGFSEGRRFDLAVQGGGL
ncbi:heme NO-binding domain-containing protein [Gemmobacter denitrificans]|uniref:Heme NO-binding domain-containing protein n=1 Tax=Gemmobacter denitrificans TaxID=3123040 RepID=A0ABU8BWE1_9RHOB